MNDRKACGWHGTSLRQKDAATWIKSRSAKMKISDLKNSGHWPTLLTAFLYFDFSFMVWTILGPLSAHISESLKLGPEQTGFMAAVPSLSGAALRIALGLLSDRLGSKRTGLLAQCIVIAALAWAWLAGLNSFPALLVMGFMLGFAGASFAVALPQAGRWYPPHLQGTVLGLAGAGNVGVVIDSLLAPRLANAYGWRTVFGLALIPAVLVLISYMMFSKEAPGHAKSRKLSDYTTLLKDRDTHWFCFFYTVTFGGFAGLAASLVMYFKSTYGLSKVGAGDLAALCTFVGVMARPIGGFLADKLGGTRSLQVCYVVGGVMLGACAFATALPLNVGLLLVAMAALGAGNGAVFQLLPQRFSKEIGTMTGLVGAGGGVGGFLLAAGLGWSRGVTGSYAAGLIVFAVFCALALTGLRTVKHRWRSTWGAMAAARV
ncbi:MAG: major facilitator superfamily 1 [Verrucomicrobiales bacterium]|nr:major facilitator superfamily 1 [Verrucomicrobiales bacterium]